MFIVSIWSTAWVGAPAWLKSCLVAAERTFRQKSWHREDARGAQRLLGLGRLLVVLKGRAFGRDIDAAQPGDQATCGGQSRGHAPFWWVSPAPPGSGSPGSHRAGGLPGQNLGHADLEGLVQVLLQDREGFLGVLDFTPLILGWSGHARRGRGHHSGFAFLRDVGISGVSQTICGKIWLTPSGATSLPRRSPERGRCGRPADACWPDDWQRLHWGGIVLLNLGAQPMLIGNKELSSKKQNKAKKRCGWSQRLRIAEWLFPKAQLEKKVGGWSEAGGGGVPGSVLTKSCWSRRQIGEPLSEPPYLLRGNRNVCMTCSAEVLAFLWWSGTEPW